MSTSDAITLDEAKGLIRCLAHEESLLLVSGPGVGKSDIVRLAAAEAGLECRALLGTQIAPEDVSGVPKLLRERTVFCPPRVVLPEDDRPFCLFLDELPASPPDVQKAFYSLLLERRLGEYRLPRNSWVVAAGNRVEDQALTRTLSSALVNRLFVVPIRVDVAGWLAWAERSGVRAEVRAFIHYVPQALCRPAPRDPVPFSTPRAWALMSRDLDLAERDGRLNESERRAIAFGRLSPEDAGLFCALAEDGLGELRPLADYLRDPSLLPKQPTAMWFVVSRLRRAVERDELRPPDAGDEFPARVRALLAAIPQEYLFALLVDLEPRWYDLGAEPTLVNEMVVWANRVMLDKLFDVTGLGSWTGIDLTEADDEPGGEQP
jgi:hypothetical protein